MLQEIEVNYMEVYDLKIVKAGSNDCVKSLGHSETNK